MNRHDLSGKLAALTALGLVKQAAPSPYRERVEVYGLTPGGRILGGFYPEDRSFGVFGGGIDPRETLFDAAKREYLEEAGRRIQDLQPVGKPFIQPWLTHDASVKQRQRIKQYPEGTKTHYLIGQLGRHGAAKNTADTATHLQDIKLRPLTDIIAAQERALATNTTPDITARLQQRLNVLKQIQALQNKKQAEFAPGIPAGKSISPLPTITRDTLNRWTLAVQEHQTDRSKGRTHADLRLVDPDSAKAHSWAIPKARLPEPGEKLLAVQTFTHTPDYALHFGEKKPERIGKGYGKGTVKLTVKKPVDIVEASNDKVRFNLQQGRDISKYLLRRTKDNKWLLFNTTMTTLKEKTAALYHGSPSHLNVIEPRNEHGDPDVSAVVFAAPNRTFALPYAGKKWGDRDIEQGVRGGGKTPLRMLLREMRPGAFKDVFNTPGYLYTLPEKGFTDANRRTHLEMLNPSAVTPLKTQQLTNVLRTLKRHKDIELLSYDPATPATKKALQRMIKRMREMPPEDRKEYRQWRLENAPSEIKTLFEKLEKTAQLYHYTDAPTKTQIEQHGAILPIDETHPENVKNYRGRGASTEEILRKAKLLEPDKPYKNYGVYTTPLPPGSLPQFQNALYFAIPYEKIPDSSILTYKHPITGQKVRKPATPKAIELAKKLWSRDQIDMLLKKLEKKEHTTGKKRWPFIWLPQVVSFEPLAVNKNQPKDLANTSTKKQQHRFEQRLSLRGL